MITLTGHTGNVWCVAAADDGHVLTGSYDKTVKVWRGDELVRTIEAHTDDVNAVAVLPGGARFVSGSIDETAKLFTFGGELERTFEVGSPVRCAAALPDGVHFVVGLGCSNQNEHEFLLYHVDGTLVHAFVQHDFSIDYVQALAVTPDGQHIISGGDFGRVKVWSVATKSLVSTCAGHTNEVYAVAAMPDGKRILSGAFDKTVRVWLLNGNLKNTFRQLHTSYVRALVAMPDNQHALSGGSCGTVKLFNVNDGAVLRTFSNHTRDVNCLALLPDGRRFVSASDDETACIVEHGLAPFV